VSDFDANGTAYHFGGVALAAIIEPAHSGLVAIRNQIVFTTNFRNFVFSHSLGQERTTE
jgi:hypothetical protein